MHLPAWHTTPTTTSVDYQEGGGYNFDAVSLQDLSLVGWNSGYAACGSTMMREPSGFSYHDNGAYLVENGYSQEINFALEEG